MEQELKSYFKIIIKRLWTIVSVVLLCAITTGIISYYYIKPVYEANVTLIVNKTSENQGLQSLDYNNVSTNIMLINTYKEIISTPVILDKVLDRLPNINLTLEKLSTKVKVNSVNETQVMTIVAEDSSYNQAVKIVNMVAEVFKNEIPNIMKVDNVTILNEAKEKNNVKPISPNPKLNILLSLVVSLMISIGIAFLLEYMDDSLKTETDIEKYLNVPTLGVIMKIKSRDIKKNATSKQILLTEGSYVSANQ